jgi:hypothetical protein
VRLLAPGVIGGHAFDTPLPFRLIPRAVPLCATGESVVWLTVDPHASITRDGILHVPPGATGEALFDAGHVRNAYPRLAWTGEGTVTLHYAERLSAGGDAVRDPQRPHDPLCGPLTDQVRATGPSGAWQPFFRRAFRFLRVIATAGRTPLELQLESTRDTGYPFRAAAPFESDHLRHRTLDIIATRTLRACAHDTFEDCPYYEQMQYAGDVLVQARTALWMCGDTDLAGQAVRQFAWSLGSDGLTASRWPSRIPQTIPTWSLLWMLSAREHWLQSRDLETARTCAPAVSQVVDWFLRRRSRDGLLYALPGWLFCDWAQGWTMGVPPGAGTEPSALVHFLLVAALRADITLSNALGDRARARTVRRAANELACNARMAFFHPERGLFLDTRSVDGPASRLANAWAILSGVCPPANQVALADRLAADNTLTEPELFGRFFVFDALMQAGRHDLAAGMLEVYEDLIEQGFTTWPESLHHPRSECHGWSNLPGYALRRLYLGLDFSDYGARRVTLQPWPGRLTRASGRIPLDTGPLDVAWTLDGDDGLRIELEVPPHLTVIARDARGGRRVLRSGRHRWSAPR